MEPKLQEMNNYYINVFTEITCQQIKSKQGKQKETSLTNAVFPMSHSLNVTIGPILPTLREVPNNRSKLEDSD
jgi:hypothetical protein